MRVQHSGSDFEVNNMNSGFFSDLWQRGDAARVYRLACNTGVPGNQACAAGNQRAIESGQPERLLPDGVRRQHRAGLGQAAERDHYRRHGREEGRDLFHVPVTHLGAACGHGVERDRRRQDGAASVLGHFLQLPAIDGGRRLSVLRRLFTVSCTRQLRWARFGDITAATATNLIENPVNVTVGGYEQPLSKSHNVNVAFQRDIGFNTVAEIAFVGNYTWNHGRFVDDNRLPLYVYGDPANLVNNAPIAANSLRYQIWRIPGHGLGQPLRACALCQDAAVQRDADAAPARLTNGLQMGFAYTLAKGEGYTGYDPYTDQIGGEAAIRGRYWGPTSDDRRHNLSATWSYDVPTWTEKPVIKQLVMDWQVSGIFRMLSGQAITPRCASNNRGDRQLQSVVDRRDRRRPLRVHRRADFQRLHRGIRACRKPIGRTSTSPRSVCRSRMGASVTSATRRSAFCVIRRGTSGTSPCHGASRST